MQLFYHPEITPGDREIAFPKDESRHIVKVLRKQEGDTLHLTNGKGWIFTTVLTLADPKGCSAQILSSHEEPSPDYHLHMAVAPTKMNDRFEWFLEKATEIGIHEITPVICDHSERKVVKLERFNRVLQSALKQSLHTHFPILNEPVSFAEFMTKPLEGQKFIAHCEESGDKKFFFDQIKKNGSLTVLIGPEGDFSNAEISKALSEEWIPVSLGKSRLRTETAAIVACHSAALKHEQ